MQCSVSAVPGRCPFVPGRCPMVPGRCPTVPGGCPMVQGWCSIVPGRCLMVLGRCPMVPLRCPMVPLRCPMVPGRCLPSTVYCQRVLHCKSAVASKKRFLKQLGPGVLTKSNTEKGGQLTDSVPMSTRRQPSNPPLRLGLLGCQLVDIGMKLHLVHFAVKFSSASAAPWLRRT